MPGRGTMKVSTHRTVGQTLTDDEGREFELPIVDDIYDPSHTAIVSDLPDGRVLISYLVVDEDAEHMDPRQDCSGWQEFDILDSQRDADELSSKLNDCECGYHYADHLDDDGNMRTDLDTWLNCEGYVKPPARQAIDAGRAFLFEKYEHGLVCYALKGESSQVDRQWDVSPVAGFMWADDDWGADVDIEDAARNFLETFTDWCNGNIWGIVHAWYGLVDDAWVEVADYESCWGYIGDYAETEMRFEHEHYKGVTV